MSYKRVMNTNTTHRTLRPSDMMEAASNFEGKFPYMPVAVRPPEEQEAAVTAHQERIDAARNEGLLLEPEDGEQMRFTYLWRPGYEDSPRGIQLGYGLGYRSKAAVGHEHVNMAPTTFG